MSTIKRMEDSDLLKLENVRLSFSSLFARAIFNGVEGKYDATFLVDKKYVNVKKVLDLEIKQLLDDSKLKITQRNLFIKDGDDFDYEGYENNWVLKSSSYYQPKIATIGNEYITTDDTNMFYSGCYVNAVIRIYLQNNKYGKRINAMLYAIQFVRDGDVLFKKRTCDYFDDLREVPF